eukprot:Sspe_Gene.104079::Locus_79954_Transcript_1_1_Confidence_1.000_Length_1269::g.104079::m.104079
MKKDLLTFSSVSTGSTALQTKKCKAKSLTPPEISCRAVALAGRYRVLSKVGGGTFGDIYEGLDVVTNRPVAIKLETNRPYKLLEHEARLLKVLNAGNDGKGAPGIPFMHHFGTEGDFHYMVLDLCGPSVEDLFRYCRKKLSFATVAMLADQMLHRLEYLHAMGFIHRDIKPENFVMGRGVQSHHVFMIDYGLAKRYRDKSNRHIPLRTGKPMVGTTRYASVNAHIGCEQSRRDDMEGLGLVLVYLSRGSLPWQGMLESGKVKDRRILERKMHTTTRQLCDGLAPCFEQYMGYVKSLRYSECPDYNKCRVMFRAAFQETENRDYDWVFDWISQYREHKQPLGLSMINAETSIGMGSGASAGPPASNSSLRSCRFVRSRNSQRPSNEKEELEGGKDT